MSRRDFNWRSEDIFPNQTLAKLLRFVNFVLRVYACMYVYEYIHVCVFIIKYMSVYMYSLSKINIFKMITECYLLEILSLFLLKKQQD